jgi:hypothetical protein
MTKKPKICSKCKQEKPIDQFPTRWYKPKEGKKYKVPHTPCYECKREENRVQKQKAKDKGIYYEREKKYKKKYKERNLAKVRQKQREYAAAKRRENGAKPNARSSKRIKKGKATLLPIDPIKQYLNSLDKTKHQIAEYTNIDSGVIGRIMTGKDASIKDGIKTHVTEHLVDRILVELGEPHKLNELYPLED